MSADNNSIKVQTTCRSAAANASINTPLPTLTKLSIIDKRGYKKDKFKYGETVFIEVGTTGLTSYNYIAIRVSNPDWKTVKEYSQHECAITHNFSSVDGKKIQVFKLKFSAKTEWLKNQSKFDSPTTVEAFLCGSNILPLMFHSWDQMKNDVDYDNPISELKVEDIEISKIVIVLDPGHGFASGFTGTQCRWFHYYDKKTDGTPDKTKTIKAKAASLPSHVIADIATWVKHYTSESVSVEETEWFYVIDICLNIKRRLELNNNYKVLLTRDVATLHQDPKGKQTRVQISGSDNYTNRRNFANTNKADFFISIHCDGQSDYKLSGGFVVIPRNTDSNNNLIDIEKSRQLGNDLMNYYNVITPHYTSAKPGPVVQLTEEKSILISNNMTLRRLIIELGRMTNPNDIMALYANGAKIIFLSNL